MKKARIIMALLVLLGAASLAEAQIVVSSTTASTTRIQPKISREKGLVIRPAIDLGLVSYKGPIIGINGTLDYQFNAYFAIGGGFGYDYDFYSGGMSWIPLFANARVYFCERQWSPFFELNVGYDIPITNSIEENTSWGTYENYEDLRTFQIENFFIGGILGIQYNGFDFGIAVRYLNGFHTFERYVNGSLLQYDETGDPGVSISINFGYNFQLSKN